MNRVCMKLVRILAVFSTRVKFSVFDEFVKNHSTTANPIYLYCNLSSPDVDQFYASRRLFVELFKNAFFVRMDSHMNDTMGATMLVKALKNV